MSDWYDKTGEPSTGSSGSSSTMRSEFALIETAMAKLPTLTGNGLEIVRVNTGATALETITVATLAGLIGTQGFTTDDATESGVTNAITIGHTTTGTPAAGIGTGIAFVTETTAGNETGMVLASVATDVASGTEDFKLSVQLMAGGSAAAEKMSVSSAGLVTAANGFTASGGQFTGDGSGLTGTAASLTAGAVTTNANLTGEVTSVGNAAQIDVTAITNQTLVTAVGSDTVLIVDATDGALKKALISDFASAGGDMAAATYDPANIAQQLVGLTATQTLTNKTINASSNTLSNITYSMIASGSRTGLDFKLVTGTAGTSGNLAQWDANGDAVDSSIAASSIVTSSSTTTLTNKTINSASNTITITEANISDLGAYITAAGVTFENLNANGDIGSGASQIPAGNHTHAYLANLSEDTTPDLGGPLGGGDNIVSRVNLKDIGYVHNPIGSIGGGTQSIDLTLGNVHSGTVDTSATTFTFDNPTASDEYCEFVLILTNPGSQTITWPTGVDWQGGIEPSWTSSGVDIAVFATIDGGTTWHGKAISLDSK